MAASFDEREVIVREFGGRTPTLPDLVEEPPDEVTLANATAFPLAGPAADMPNRHK